MRFALAIAVLVCASRPADACMSVFERGIVSAPAFEPADAVSITSETVDVTCDEHYGCTVVSTFDVAVRAVARISVTGYHTDNMSIAIEGAPADQAARDLHPGDTRFVLRARVALPEYIDGCFIAGVIARHRYLASRPRGNQHVLQIDTAAKPRIHAPSSWSLDVDALPAYGRDPATTRLWFTVPGRIFTLGGPLVMLGAFDGQGHVLRLHAAWEAAIAKPWLVFALAGQTDFLDTWNAALTVEPTSSAWLASFGGGGGIVVANGGRIGGRGQLSVAFGAIRAMLVVDMIGGAGSDASELAVGGLLGVGL